jgi:hypothetical protein
MNAGRLAVSLVRGAFATCALCLGWTLWVGYAQAQVAAAAPAEPAPPSAATPEQASNKPPPVTLGAYVEAYWQWNFNRPDNRLTNYRGFDNRHDSITLENLALDAKFDVQDVYARITLQVGNAASTYYLDEPVSPGTEGVNRSDGSLWKYIQQGYAGYRLRLRRAQLKTEAGIYLSPVGPESMVVHENWNWSRANTFFGLPFYHTGARVELNPGDAAALDDPTGDHWALSVGVYNGWNSVVDNNGEKSLALQAVWKRAQAWKLSLLYFGGVERPDGSPEGKPWRSLFDAYVEWQGAGRLALRLHADSGFERTRFGTDAWVGGAGSLRLRLFPMLYLAARGDTLYEHVPANELGRASPICFPVSWVSSGTGTLEFAPRDHLSLRLEYRHDTAASPLFFRGQTGEPGEPNTRQQNTLMLGATAWF